MGYNLTVIYCDTCVQRCQQHDASFHWPLLGFLHPVLIYVVMLVEDSLSDFAPGSSIFIYSQPSGAEETPRKAFLALSHRLDSWILALNAHNGASGPHVIGPWVPHPEGLVLMYVASQPLATASRLHSTGSVGPGCY